MSKDSKWKKIVEENEELVSENEAEEVAAEITEESREELEQDLNVADEKTRLLEDKVQRLQAEMMNLQKQADKRVQDAHKFAAGKLLGDFIPVVDSIIHGLQIEPGDNPQAKSLQEGLQLTFSQFEKALSKNGVSIVDPEKGDPFDPQYHEAMSMVPDPKAKSNTILQVLQKGYELNGRVIKAAMVIVAQ